MILFTIFKHILYHMFSVVWFLLLITVVVPLIIHIITGETWGDILRGAERILCKTKN